MVLNEVTKELDPDWTIFRRFSCGHVEHSCCEPHLSPHCLVCSGDVAL